MFSMLSMHMRNMPMNDHESTINDFLFMTIQYQSQQTSEPHAKSLRYVFLCCIYLNEFLNSFSEIVSS